VSEEVDRALAVFDWLTGADEDMTVGAQLEARDAGSRSPRVDTAFLVLLRCAAGKFPARITNLSATGFRLEAPRQLEAGWEVTLEAPKLRPVKCVIRWASGKEAGGVFLDSVSL
jgi:hypothetical protein